MEPRIRLELQIEDNLYVQVNKDQLKQILMNILLNSIESMKEKLLTTDGILTLSITAGSEANCIMIQIRDEGTGMSPEQLDRCTEIFFTTKRAGTGLGLALSKQYIEENGGHFHIESQQGVYTSIKLLFARCKI